MFERRLFAPAEVSIKFAILFSPSSEFGFMCSIVANEVRTSLLAISCWVLSAYLTIKAFSLVTDVGR